MVEGNLDLSNEPEKISNSNDQHRFGSAWTIIKLEAIEKYLIAFNNALSKQNFTRLYIDAFAGTGRCEITIDGQKMVIDGSARRALGINPEFHKFYFVELSPKKAAALKTLADENSQKSINIIQKDANTALKDICKKYYWRKERAVLFLDPFGMEVEWETLKLISSTAAIDVWYLFPYSGLYRQATKSADNLDIDKVKSITRVLGTDEWRRLFYEKNKQQSLFEVENSDVRNVDHSQMLDYVSQRLKILFPAVTKPKILYARGNSKNSAGPPLFALYFAASNPSPKAFGLATKIANDIMDAL